MDKHLLLAEHVRHVLRRAITARVAPHRRLALRATTAQQALHPVHSILVQLLAIIVPRARTHRNHALLELSVLLRITFLVQGHQAPTALQERQHRVPVPRPLDNTVLAARSPSQHAPIPIHALVAPLHHTQLDAAVHGMFC